MAEIEHFLTTNAVNGQRSRFGKSLFCKHHKTGFSLERITKGAPDNEQDICTLFPRDC